MGWFDVDWRSTVSIFCSIIPSMHRVQNSLFALTLLIGGAAKLAADPLTEVDRMELLEGLNKLKGEARERALSRFGGASAAFREGMQSEDAATALYLKCVEKVDFIEKDRKTSEFRDWRKRNDKRLDDEAHALALRHQLRWTVLTMTAAGSPEKCHELAVEALGMLSSIYQTPAELRPYTHVLGQPVSSTYFAKAYGLTGYKIPSWPMAPLDSGQQGVRVDGPFQKLIFPALRAKQDIPGLRAAWDKRIQFEEIAAGFWSKEAADEKNPGMSEARERFLLEAKPQLEWAKEADLFQSGDERVAAINMFKHLEANLSHSDARDWEAQFRELINPTEPEVDPS